MADRFGHGCILVDGESAIEARNATMVDGHEDAVRGCRLKKRVPRFRHVHRLVEASLDHLEVDPVTQPGGDKGRSEQRRGAVGKNREGVWTKAGDCAAVAAGFDSPRRTGELTHLAVTEGVARQNAKLPRHRAGITADALTPRTEVRRRPRQPWKPLKGRGVHVGNRFGRRWTNAPSQGIFSPMSHEYIYSRLIGIFRDVFDDESLVPNPAMTAKDVAEWDSLNHVRLMVAIEKAFSVHFTTAEVSGLPDVGHLVDVIAAKLAAEGRQSDG